MREAASAAVFRTIANTILPNSIKMVEDTPGKHPSGYLPILDTEMKVENGKIIFRHFKKPMASFEVVNARSAMSQSSQISILVQEASRVLRNCAPTLPWDQKLVFLNKLMISMKWAGHPESVREIVARRSLARYFTNLRNLADTGRPLYRSMDMRRETLKEDKATWFRAQGATATIMVPWTPESSLARKLREVVKSSGGPRGTSVKVVERPGQSIMSQVSSGKLFTRESCGRDTCPIRQSNKHCFDSCYKEGVVYLSFCKLCESSERASVYIGETSRTIFTRAGQHHRDYRRIKKRAENVAAVMEGTQSSWILDHVRTMHEGEDIPDSEQIVDFRLLSDHQDPFTRQTVEAVWIQEALDKGQLQLGRKMLKISSLNRKGEYFCARERWDSRR